MPEDSTGKFITVGNCVRFRGKEYTIKTFGPRTGCYDTSTIIFEEEQETNEVADEISVDLID